MTTNMPVDEVPSSQQNVSSDPAIIQVSQSNNVDPPQESPASGPLPDVESAGRTNRPAAAVAAKMGPLLLPNRSLFPIRAYQLLIIELLAYLLMDNVISYLPWYSHIIHFVDLLRNEHLLMCSTIYGVYLILIGVFSARSAPLCKRPITTLLAWTMLILMNGIALQMVGRHFVHYGQASTLVALLVPTLLMTNVIIILNERSSLGRLQGRSSAVSVCGVGALHVSCSALISSTLIVLALWAVNGFCLRCSFHSEPILVLNALLAILASNVSLKSKITEILI